jgi:signal transduction histidine kinase
MTRSLRTVLTLRFVALILLPLLIIAAVIWLLLLPRMTERVAAEHRALATALAYETERYLEQPVRALRGAAVTLSQEKDRDRRPGSLLPNRLLESLVLGGDALEGAYALDARGHLIEIALASGLSRNIGNYIGLDLSANPLSGEAHRSGRKVFSESYLSGVTEQVTVAATVPAGERLLVAEIGLRRLSDFVRRVATSADMRLIVVDGRGQIVAHPDAALASQQLNIGNLSILVQTRGSRTGSVTAVFEFDGRKVLGTTYTIAGTEWTVLVTEPLARVHQPIWEILYGLLLAGLVSMVLAIGVGILMATGFSIRFERLSTLARELAAGRYPETWPESNVTEASALIGSIRQMADAVRQREVDLRDLNAELEARVQARTEDLELANAELSAAMNTLEQAQDELVRSEKLAALGSLVAGVAHELNTPIGNSLMVASTLQERTDEFESGLENGLTRTALNRQLSTSREAAASLVRNLQRAGELIASFKQVAVDQTTSARRLFALDEVVREIILTLSPALKKMPWKIESDIPTAIWLESYPGPLGQVLTNLINNAVLHAFDGLPAGMVRIGAQTLDASTVQLTLADDGNGILPEHLPRIFDPFFTTRMGRGGTGLGLSICHNIVENILGGRVNVASTPGQGTVFTLTLPLVAPVGPDDEEGALA